MFYFPFMNVLEGRKLLTKRVVDDQTLILNKCKRSKTYLHNRSIILHDIQPMNWRWIFMCKTTKDMFFAPVFSSEHSPQNRGHEGLFLPLPIKLFLQFHS